MVQLFGLAVVVAAVVALVGWFMWHRYQRRIQRQQDRKRMVRTHATRCGGACCCCCFMPVLRGVPLTKHPRSVPSHLATDVRVLRGLWRMQLEDMIAFVREEVAFLDAAHHDNGIPAEHLLDAYTEDRSVDEAAEARAMWPQVMRAVSQDTRMQRQQKKIRGRQMAHLYEWGCGRGEHALGVGAGRGGCWWLFVVVLYHWAL